MAKVECLENVLMFKQDTFQMTVVIFLLSGNNQILL